jgi:nucleoside-diphosphate-sugar epimerase
MKVILFGSTGMIGQGVLTECLKDTQIESVLVVNRQSCKVTHAKLIEIIHNDFFDLSTISKQLGGYDACFYCLGITSAGLSEADYHKNTFELTTKVADAVLKANKSISFCYISGAGADSSEKGKTMWARVKGKTENALLHMPFKSAYMFRPGYIQPLNGIESRTKLYRIMYAIFKPFYFILKHYEGMVTNTETLGKAMIAVVLKGSDKRILESRDINEIVRNN